MTDTTDTRFRIGQVCDQLREEFPDISISKLRFLQDKGIIDPERTPGGYRIYTASDVEALRQALIMQRDQFMPLKVIREELRRRLDGGAPAVPAASAASTATSPAVGAPRPAGTLPAAGQVRLGVEEPLVTADAVVRAAGITHEFLEACRSADIVAGRRDPDGSGLLFTQDEVGLLSIAGALAKVGLDVRHLRQAATAMSRQGAIVEQYASALLRAPGEEARERGLRAVEQLTSQLAEFLRIAFVRDVKLMTARATGTGRSPHQDPRVTAPLI
ncbi:MAG: MerR family transcriptional regulator [Thermoleophilia bacterium]|jgi:DNA-binding transcriptional MerR regulator|nr:MerR family transcriptional regulator [Thermoleophilia bacterium]